MRLKTGLKEAHILDRLQYHPDILEFHLNAEDVLDTTRLVQCIERVHATGCQVVLHHPPRFREQEFLDIISQSRELFDFYTTSTMTLIDICQRYGTRTVIHAHYMKSESSFVDEDRVQQMKDRIDEFDSQGHDVLLWENTVDGIFSTNNPNWISGIVAPLNLNLCFDVSHAFIASKGDNAALHTALCDAFPYVQYYHVVDSSGLIHDGLPVGDGQIDWGMVAPYVRGKDFIYEVDLAATYHADCTPMLKSREYFVPLLEGQS